MTKKILLDTNFLTAPFQLSFSLFDELDRLYPAAEVCTIEDAVQEAKSIEQGKYKELVPQLIEKEGIKVLQTEGEGEVDDLLVELSDKFTVATNDRELRERIAEKGHPVIIIRQKNHLEVINEREDYL
jgi:rRNA-processing protein FCF1